MRNFNQQITVALTSMAAFLGGSAIESNVVKADQAPISPPKIFKQCAQVATQQEIVIQQNQTATTDTAYGWEVSVPKGSVGRASFKLLIEQGGLIKDVYGDSCDGVATDEGFMRLTVGKFTERIPDSTTSIIFDNAGFNQQNPVESTSEGRFSYERACRVARRHGRNTVRLDLIQDMTYTEPGYPTFWGEGDVSEEFINGFPQPKYGLPCVQNKHGYHYDMKPQATYGVVPLPTPVLVSEPTSPLGTWNSPNF